MNTHRTVTTTATDLLAQLAPHHAGRREHRLAYALRLDHAMREAQREGCVSELVAGVQAMNRGERTAMRCAS